MQGVFLNMLLKFCSSGCEPCWGKKFVFCPKMVWVIASSVQLYSVFFLFLAVNSTEKETFEHVTADGELRSCWKYFSFVVLSLYEDSCLSQLQNVSITPDQNKWPNSKPICHWWPFSAPKEKPCCTLPTVKKLLEQKRRRETSFVLPSYSTASPSLVPSTTVTVRSDSESHWMYSYNKDVILNHSPFFFLFPPSIWVYQIHLSPQVRAERLVHNT